MNPIQLEIEGTGAIAATESLLSMDSIEATYETVGDDTKEGTLAAIASIVAKNLRIFESLRNQVLQL